MWYIWRKFWIEGRRWICRAMSYLSARTTILRRCFGWTCILWRSQAEVLDVVIDSGGNNYSLVQFVEHHQGQDVNCVCGWYGEFTAIVTQPDRSQLHSEFLNFRYFLNPNNLNASGYLESNKSLAMPYAIQHRISITARWKYQRWRMRQKQWCQIYCKGMNMNSFSCQFVSARELMSPI
jgi:hypothetical protein